MALNQQQRKFIAEVNDKVGLIMANDGSEKTLLVEMSGYMPSMKDIIDTANENELHMYYRKYQDFFYYMGVLEDLNIPSGPLPFLEVVKINRAVPTNVIKGS